jgi:hypothetical protein
LSFDRANPQEQPAISMPPGVIALREIFGQCRHGVELRDVSAQEGPDGWVIWGHYSCQQCNKVALHVSGETPRAVTVSGRLLPVLLS